MSNYVLKKMLVRSIPSTSNSDFGLKLICTTIEIRNHVFHTLESNLLVFKKENYSSEVPGLG